jgi:hypothetical protein
MVLERGDRRNKEAIIRRMEDEEKEHSSRI